MTQQKATKDELFLMKLHEEAGFDFIAGDLIGKLIGASPKMASNIVKHLAQANFVKKGEEGQVRLTEQGYALVRFLTAQK